MTGEPVMRTALVRREQPARERAVSAAGVAELRRMALMSVASDHSKRNYAKALDEIFALCKLRMLIPFVIVNCRLGNQPYLAGVRSIGLYAESERKTLESDRPPAR
jgi:hypothetical protein